MSAPFRNSSQAGKASKAIGLQKVLKYNEARVKAQGKRIRSLADMNTYPLASSEVLAGGDPLIAHLTSCTTNSMLSIIQLAPLLSHNFTKERPTVLFEGIDGVLGIKLLSLESDAQVACKIKDGNTLVLEDIQSSKISFIVEIKDLPQFRGQKYAYHMKDGTQTGNTRAKMGHQAAQVLKSWLEGTVIKIKDEYNPFRLGAEGRTFDDLYLVALVPKSGTKCMYTCIIGYYPILQRVAGPTSLPSPRSLSSVHEHAPAMEAAICGPVLPINSQVASSDVSGASNAPIAAKGLSSVQLEAGVREIAPQLEGHLPMLTDMTAHGSYWASLDTFPGPVTHMSQRMPATNPREFVSRSFSAPEQLHYHNTTTSQGLPGPSRISDAANWLNPWNNNSGRTFLAGQDFMCADPESYDGLSLMQSIDPSAGCINPAVLSYNGYANPGASPDGFQTQWPNES